MPKGTRAKAGAGSITIHGYRMMTRKGHPIAGKNGQVFEHRVVLYDSIGPGIHPCHWCRIPVSWERPHRLGALVVDHVDTDKLNNDLANLVPSCVMCNITRHEWWEAS